MDTLDYSERKDLKPALLIINPVSGKRMVLRNVAQIIRVLMDAGYKVTTMITGKKGDGTAFAASFGRDYQLVCCTGGDGTLNEVIHGLATANIDVPLGYIPCGSTNDFAASHGLSTDIIEAAEHIASGYSTRYDIGCFGGRHFTYVAAFGAFSWLSYTTDQNMKNVLGHTAYILDAIKDLYKIKPLHMKVTADGVTHEDDYIFGAICNTTSVAGTITLPSAMVDTADGVFEVLLVKMPKTMLELEMIIRGLLSQDYSCPNIDLFQAKELDIENPPELEWSLDGEASGVMDKAHVSVIPRFLNLRG